MLAWSYALTEPWSRGETPRRVMAVHQVCTALLGFLRLVGGGLALGLLGGRSLLGQLCSAFGGILDLARLVRLPERCERGLHGKEKVVKLEVAQRRKHIRRRRGRTVVLLGHVRRAVCKQGDAREGGKDVLFSEIAGRQSKDRRLLWGR